MLKLSSKKLVEILDIKNKVIDVEIENVVTDSRKIKKGDLFIALRGENFDGHNFVKQALEQGAQLVIVDRLFEDIDKDRQLVVTDTLKAYGLIGAFNRSLYKGVVIGLTGSSGKTTTKEELKEVLSVYGKVYATQANFNNNVGVPLTLCDLDMDSDFAIIEMGMSASGEIRELVSYVQPDIAIVTNVYPMHIEFFADLKGIAEAKAEIFEGLKKQGKAIINEDTNFADVLRKKAIENGAEVYSFGKNNHVNIKLDLQDKGEHNFYNAWCVLTVTDVLGLDINKAVDVLNNFKALAGRGAKHNLQLPAGGEFMLIDDSYSGQPEAMKLALIELSKLNCEGRKIAVLGKMAELGASSKEQHIGIGKLISNLDIDIVVGVCEEMKDMLAQLPAEKEKYYFDNNNGLDEFLLNNCLQNKDILLIKGARYSSRMYQTAESLIKKGSK